MKRLRRALGGKKGGKKSKAPKKASKSATKRGKTSSTDTDAAGAPREADLADPKVGFPVEVAEAVKAGPPAASASSSSTGAGGEGAVAPALSVRTDMQVALNGDDLAAGGSGGGAGGGGGAGASPERRGGGGGDHDGTDKLDDLHSSSTRERGSTLGRVVPETVGADGAARERIEWEVTSTGIVGIIFKAGAGGRGATCRGLRPGSLSEAYSNLHVGDRLVSMGTRVVEQEPFDAILSLWQNAERPLQLLFHREGGAADHFRAAARAGSPTRSKGRVASQGTDKGGDGGRGKGGGSGKSGLPPPPAFEGDEGERGAAAIAAAAAAAATAAAAALDGSGGEGMNIGLVGSPKSPLPGRPVPAVPPPQDGFGAGGEGTRTSGSTSDAAKEASILSNGVGGGGGGNEIGAGNDGKTGGAGGNGGGGEVGVNNRGDRADRADLGEQKQQPRQPQIRSGTVVAQELLSAKDPQRDEVEDEAAVHAEICRKYKDLGLGLAEETQHILGVRPGDAKHAMEVRWGSCV